MKKEVIVLVLNKKTQKYQEKFLTVKTKEVVKLLVSDVKTTDIVEKVTYQKRDITPWEVKKKLELVRNEPKVEKLIERYPEVARYRDYFKNKSEKNSYLIIMKQAAINDIYHICKSDNLLTTQVVGKIMNLHHATVLYHKGITETQRHPDYVEVVSIMDKMMQKGLYPYGYSETNNYETGRRKYKWKPFK